MVCVEFKVCNRKLSPASANRKQGPGGMFQVQWGSNYYSPQQHHQREKRINKNRERERERERGEGFRGMGFNKSINNISWFHVILVQQPMQFHLIISIITCSMSFLCLILPSSALGIFVDKNNAKMLLQNSHMNTPSMIQTYRG